MIRIGIVLNHKSAEKKKDELLSTRSKKRPWLKNVEKKYTIKRKNVPYVPADVAVGYYIMEHYPKMEVDFINPEDISVKRFRSNDIVFILIYDLLESFHLDGRKKYNNYKHVLKTAGNVYPPYDIQKLINNKCLYYKLLEKQKIPVAPTYCVSRSKWNKRDTRNYTKTLIKKINHNKWKDFIAKPVLGQESKDFKKFKRCSKTSTKKPLFCRQSDFIKYLNHTIPKYKQIVLQEYVPGFDKDNKEIRMYYINGKYSYSVVTTHDDVTLPKQEGGTTNVKHFSYLKRLAKKVIKELPTIKVGKKEEPPLLLRIDIGSGLEGVKYEYFINEIEFVPSLYVEDIKVMADVILAKAMVKFVKKVL